MNPVELATDYVSRLGFEEEAHKFQDLNCVGKQQEAITAFPDALMDIVAGELL